MVLQDEGSVTECCMAAAVGGIRNCCVGNEGEIDLDDDKVPLVVEFASFETLRGVVYLQTPDREEEVRLERRNSKSVIPPSYILNSLPLFTSLLSPPIIPTLFSIVSLRLSLSVSILRLPNFPLPNIRRWRRRCAF